MKLNDQPRESADLDMLGSLEVHHAWETIQGEGPFVGTPAVFLRLAGCNLQCPFCDTDYTSQRKRLSVLQCVELVRSIRPSGLVVLTGGEPLRQNLIPFCREIRMTHDVQIETNGTYDQDLTGLAHIVCSPKTPKIHPGMHNHVDAWKYVLSADAVDPDDGLPSAALGGFRPARPQNDDGWAPTIYVQPLDEQDEEKNKRHIEAAVQSCLKFGYRLCLQTHKMVGLE